MSGLLAGGAFAGVLAAIVGFWNQIKSILWKIVSIFILKVEINTEEAHEAITAYLINNFKKLGNYDRVYGATNETFRDGKYGLVAFERFGAKTLIFWSNKPCCTWIPFAFSKEPNPQENEQMHHSQNKDRKYSSFIFIRGTIDVDEIIRNSIDARNKTFWKHNDGIENNRFDIFYLPNKETNNYAYHSRSSNSVAWYKQEQYRLLGTTQSELGRERSNSGKALENLFFPKEVKELINIISLWVKSQDWHKNKNIPWKRGWLLYGPSGTGKTALVRAFAEDLNMPIYVYSLSQMNNSELISAWKRMQVNIPCIALIEDIDSVFNKRENISQKSGMLMDLLRSEPEYSGERGYDSENNSSKYSPLTFDCLLNCIDGVDKSNGIFTIITTNKLDNIDEAIGVPETLADGTRTFISSRPGRIDKAIELTYMSPENKIEMANKILGDFPDQLDKMLQSISGRKEETPAQFQEACSQIAILEHWNAKNPQEKLFK